MRVAHTSNGRGLVAHKDLREGELIASVPLSCCLTVPDGPGDTQALAEALLHACEADSLWLELERGGLLPVSVDAAWLWEPEDIEELQWPQAVGDALARRHQLRTVAARMPSGVPFERRLWALSLVCSRSFYVWAPEGQRCRMLAPFVDLVNNEQPAAADIASGEADASPWSLRGDRFELCAARGFASGEEVLMFYGHEASSELLINYGFCPPPVACEVVPLYTDLGELLDDDRWTPPCPGRLRRAKAALLAGADAAEAPLAVRPGGLLASSQLLGALRVLHSDADALGALEESHCPEAGHTVWQWRPGTPARVAAAVDASAIGHAAARARELLDSLPTSLAEDEAVLQSATAHEWPPQAALAYRAFVKRMLHSFVEQAEAMVAGL